MSGLAMMYATDEDIVLRAPADFAILCPRDQVLASGLDGVFDASDRWRLTSASVDFQAVGLREGHVVQLLKPVSQFRPPGESLVVASVSALGVELRRKGQGVQAGQPPSPAGGLTGVEFLVSRQPSIDG